MPTPEGIIKGEIRDYLEMMGETFLRLQSGVVKVRGGFMHLCPTGTPDFLVIRKVPHWIEIKAEGCKTQKARAEKQAEFAGKVLALGHKHIQATTLTEVIEFLDGR